MMVILASFLIKRGLGDDDICCLFLLCSAPCHHPKRPLEPVRQCWWDWEPGACNGTGWSAEEIVFIPSLKGKLLVEPGFYCTTKMCIAVDMGKAGILMCSFSGPQLGVKAR